MNDPSADFAPLEAELRQFTPNIPPGDLRIRIATALEGPPAQTTKLADRCLLSAMSLGLAAAIAIITMLGTDLLTTRETLPATPYAQSPVALQTRQFLAQLAFPH